MNKQINKQINKHELNTNKKILFSFQIAQVKKPSAESLLIPKQRRQTAQYDSLPFRLPESEWLFLGKEK